jgi:hypothetical protein
MGAGCSGGGGGEAEESRSPFRTVQRAIVDVVAAASVGDDGRLVDPASTFAHTAPQIAVVAITGDHTRSPIVLTWYQLTPDGERKLFAHTVEVASRQTAYSVGKSPGTLAAGRYRVEATLAGTTRATEFEVVEGRAIQASTPGATSGPPVAGASGAVGEASSSGPAWEGRTDGSIDTALLDVTLFHAPVDPTPPEIQLYAFGLIACEILGGNAGFLQAIAEMRGARRTVRVPIAACGTGDERSTVDRTLDFDPCVHPGGSDLPGTVVEFNVSNGMGADDIFSVVDIATKLGPDTTKPEITLSSEPRPGSRVEPGDEISVTATAKESRPGATWQTGVRSFQLTARPGGSVGDEAVAESRLPKPCASKQWTLGANGTLEVPEGASTVELCGIAEDFAGNVQTQCVTYSTGEDEVWKGTWNGGVRVLPPCTPAVWPQVGTISFTVAANGAVTGEASFTNHVGVCGGVDVPQDVPASVRFTGRRTGGGFIINEPAAGAATVRLTRSGDTATGRFTVPLGSGTRLDVRLALECASC